MSVEELESKVGESVKENHPMRVIKEPIKKTYEETTTTTVCPDTMRRVSTSKTTGSISLRYTPHPPYSEGESTGTK